ncbi:MAG: SLC13 family permease [Bacillota bacterium]|jgi:Na+/H+ antiporter NhaD/arsenite permease-like protein
MSFSPPLVAAATFVVAYLAIVFKVTRPLILLSLAALVLLLSGTISVQTAVAAINYNVLGIFFGMMVLAELFIASKAPDYLAGKVVSRVHTAGMALIAVSVFAGFISAFVDNVATVLIVAPIAFDIAHRLRTSPVPFIIGIAISSNLQGTATMIGDSTSIILATTAKLNFTDFFWMNGRPGIFFAVELGAVAATVVLWYLFRHLRQPIEFRQSTEVLTWVPTGLLVLLIIALALTSLLPKRPDYLVGVVVTGFGLLALLWNTLMGRLPFSFLELDWETFFFLIGVFVLVGSLSATGIVDMVADTISGLAGGSVFWAYVSLVFISVLVSAFVDNIPYTIAMLPVAQQVAATLGASPFLMMFGLLIGTSLGGNITPIGASANVVATGMLRRRGYSVSFGEFVGIGLPYTMAAVVAAAVMLWIVWS